MILLSPVRAALAVGAQCKEQTGKGEEALLEMLATVTPRVAAALDVADLYSGTYTDRFSLHYRQGELDSRPFRLSRGFLSSDPTITGLPDSVIGAVDKEAGLVYLDDWGGYSPKWVDITYSAGFAVPDATGSFEVHADPRYRVGADVPEWLSSAVVDFFIHWRRNNLITPSAPKEYGFLPTINDAVTRDIQARILGRYNRRRDGVYWPVTSVKV